MGRARRVGGGGGWAGRSIAQVRIRARGAATEKKTRKPSHSGLVSVCIQAAGAGGGFCGVTEPPAAVTYWVGSGQ